MTDEELSQEPHEGLSRYRDELRIAVGYLSPEGFRSGLLWTAEEYEAGEEDCEYGNRIDIVPRPPGEIQLMLGFATDRQIAALTREDLAELLQHEDGEVRMAALQVTARGARMNPSSGAQREMAVGFNPDAAFQTALGSHVRAPGS